MQLIANEVIKLVASGQNVHVACQSVGGITPKMLQEITRQNHLLEMQLLDAFWKGKAIRDRKLASR
jgi:hypothetical protein